MKSNKRSQRLSRILSIPLFVTAALCSIMPSNAHGQIFVSDYANGTIGEYNLNGTVVNSSLVTGISNGPWDMALSGSDLYVAMDNYNRVDKYTLNITTGTVISSDTSLITGLSYTSGITISGTHLFVSSAGGWVGEYNLDGTPVNTTLITAGSPYGVVVSGSDLFVSDRSSNSIGKYTLGSTPGTIVASSPSFITGLSNPEGLALSGTNLYVDNYSTGTIGEYTTSGSTVNSALISGLNTPRGSPAVYGNNLYVTAFGGGTVGEYTLTGGTVSSAFISGFNSPTGIVVVPEPSIWAMLVVSLCSLVAFRRSR